jgi:pectate lyase
MGNTEKIRSALVMALGMGLAACGGGGGGGGSDGTTAAAASSSAATSSVTSSAASSSVASSAASSSATSSAASSSATSITSLGATAWATVGTNNLGGTGTTGGNAATTAKTYTVTNRNEFIQALYANAATINTDGSYSGTLDSSSKIIYVSGTIDLSMDKALTALGESGYFTYGNASSSLNCSQYGGYASATAMWTAYYAAYKPSVWGTSALQIGSNTTVTGTPESARACYASQQKKVVYINIPSNTSIIGVGSTAKIIHGNLVIGSSSSAPVDNIVVRNISFEDAFDYFPQWDPTDSTTGRWNAAYDNVSVMYATHVWLDHNTFTDGTNVDANYPSVWNETYAGTDYASSANSLLYHVQHHDGLSDVSKNANYVTLSYNYYHDHDKSLLFGGTDTASTSAENPTALKVSVHHNYFKNLRQRQPRVRYGMVHIYNNYFEGDLSATNYPWSVGWYAGQGAKLYVENNVIVLSNASAATAATVYGGSSSTSKVSSCVSTMGTGYDANFCSAYTYHGGNLFNGSALSVQDLSSVNVTTTATPWYASGVTSGTPGATPSSYYSYTLDGTGSLATSVVAAAGAGKL